MVHAGVTRAMISAQITPQRPVPAPLEKHVADYLAATGGQVIPLYELEKAGGLAPGDLRGTAFAAKQLAIGASELRDMIADAWRASSYQSVGWKPVPVGDILAGKVDPYLPLFSSVD